MPPTQKINISHMLPTIADYTSITDVPPLMENSPGIEALNLAAAMAVL